MEILNTKTLHSVDFKLNETKIFMGGIKITCFFTLWELETPRFGIKRFDSLDSLIKHIS